MRALIFVSAIAISGAAIADEFTCDTGDATCTPLVACVEETGEIFRGFTIGGDRSGPLVAQSVTGAICKGTWRETLLGIGLAQFTCDDGRAGTSAFTWFERETGTAVGKGDFVDGTTVRFWSGSNLKRYFEEVDPAEQQRMACEPADMILS